MNYPRIVSRLLCEPWTVHPPFHVAMRRVLFSRLEGQPADPGFIPPIRNDKTDNTDTTGGVRVITIDGVIGQHLSAFEESCGGYSINSLAAELGDAAADPSVSQVLLNFITPGGAVTGIPETGRIISGFPKPIISFSDSRALSGGQWLASQADAVLGTGSSNWGSIGVYMFLLDETAALEKEGLKVNAISAGKWKLSGAPFKALSDDERAMFKADVDEIKAEFDAAILSKRKVDPEYLEGQIFNGKKAVQIGLIDGLVNNLEEAIALTSTLKK